MTRLQSLFLSLSLLYVLGSVNCHLVGGQPPVCIKISPRPGYALHMYEYSVWLPCLRVIVAEQLQLDFRSTMKRQLSLIQDAIHPRIRPLHHPFVKALSPLAWRTKARGTANQSLTIHR
ncbi:hypothetical protein M431DRAFT_279641 [Trichoderma harzianum CBS 226.95]|uniref:Secreted protein n=1 Tax=Trichoderma harzianum CBS 226.95 TaxID=983964 RepID=A0A2T4AN78_TRIHA|nr:hypothetical protein M431DRAFT_279641 [Trichoderma harzianum CBS 226.95]PTB58527.1 hypothetical protein M431DRAFT_279641 [Trichoderma harzianum CBS 226.95]